jgi:serine/threonine protein kinase
MFENTDYFFIVLEMMAGGDLFSYMERRNFDISEDQAHQIFKQIVIGVGYLHENGIVHRDLKFENILMNNDSLNAIPKIIDYGLASILGID